MLNKILSFLLPLLFLSACNTQTNQPIEERLVIGFSQSGTESPWRKQHTKSILTELEKNNEVLYENGFMNQEKQIQDIRKFIAYQVDLIIIAPLSEDGWEPILEEAKAAEIPVFIVDRNINVADASLYVTHIGPSFKAEGHRAGLYVKNFFAENEQESIRILELSGSFDASVSKLRTAGFTETISQDSRMEIVDSLSGEFIRVEGKEQLEKFIETQDLSTIDVLYSHNDEMTLGALEVIDQTDIVPGKDLIIISTDGQQTMIDELKAGRVNCVVECNPNAGWFVANAVERYFASDHKEDFVREIYITETVFSETNLDSIPPRNY